MSTRPRPTKACTVATASGTATKFSFSYLGETDSKEDLIMTEHTATPMSMCPMAETCKRMMKKPLSGIALSVPGFALMLLGVVVLIEPRILAWVVAATFIVLGAFMLMAASFIRRIGTGP